MPEFHPLFARISPTVCPNLGGGSCPPCPPASYAYVKGHSSGLRARHPKKPKERRCTHGSEQSDPNLRFNSDMYKRLRSVHMYVHTCVHTYYVRTYVYVYYVCVYVCMQARIQGGKGALAPLPPKNPHKYEFVWLNSLRQHNSQARIQGGPRGPWPPLHNPGSAYGMYVCMYVCTYTHSYRCVYRCVDDPPGRPRRSVTSWR